MVIIIHLYFPKNISLIEIIEFIIINQLKES